MNVKDFEKLNQKEQKEILGKLNQAEINMKKTLNKIKTLKKILKNKVLKK